MTSNTPNAPDAPLPSDPQPTAPPEIAEDLAAQPPVIEVMDPLSEPADNDSPDGDVPPSEPIDLAEPAPDAGFEEIPWDGMGPPPPRFAASAEADRQSTRKWISVLVGLSATAVSLGTLLLVLWLLDHLR